jgi:hypothetical protein
MFGAGFFELVFYLPPYFQSIKNTSATKSGIEVLPLLSTMLSSMVSSHSYTPFVIFGTIFSYQFGTHIYVYH